MRSSYGFTVCSSPGRRGRARHGRARRRAGWWNTRSTHWFAHRQRRCDDMLAAVFRKLLSGECKWLHGTAR